MRRDIKKREVEHKISGTVKSGKKDDMAVDYKNKTIKRTKHYKKRHRITFKKDILPAILFFFKGVAAAAMLGGLLFLGHTLYLKVKSSPYFYVRSVIFQGCDNASDKDLYALSGIKPNTSLLSMDAKVVSDKVANHPWVKRAITQKQLPNKLKIKVIEREPVAIVSLDGLYYLGESGVIFKKLEKADGADYIVVTGIKKSEAFSKKAKNRRKLTQVVKLIELLKSREVFNDKNVSEINLSRDNGITLYTYDGALSIKVGKSFSSGQFDRLVTILGKLKERDVSAERIDLDYDKRVVVKVMNNS